MPASAEVWITAPDDPDGADLLDLREWIAESPGLRDHPVTPHRETPRPGEMPGAGVVDALTTVVTDPAMATAVVTAIGGWVTARLTTRRTRLRIRRGDREIEIDTAERDLGKLSDFLRRELGDEPPEQ